MRRLSVLLVVGCCLALSVAGEELRVTTWNLRWFPSGFPRPALPEFEDQNIALAARVLRELNPDVIFLQEVRNPQTCERLIQRLAPASYSLLVCTAFKDQWSNEPSLKQVAILSSLPALAAGSEAWQTDGFVSQPGGFAFAAVRRGKAELLLYAVHLKNNVVEEDPELDAQLNILKREIAADQLLKHIAAWEADSTNQPVACIVAGNFNTNPDETRFISEDTLRRFRETGFVSGFESLPLEERITCPGKGEYANATFDYIFARNAPYVARPQVGDSTVSDHFPLTADLMITSPPAPVPPSPPAVVSVADASSPPPLDTREHRSATPPPLLFVAVLAAFALVLHLILWRFRRHVQAPAGFSVAVAAPNDGPQAPGIGELRREGSTALTRDGVLPYVARLMRDRVLRALITQRVQMVNTQYVAAAQADNLEERLAKLQAQLNERLTAYERRIAQLQRELAEKEEENRQLLNLRITLNNPALEVERSR